MASVRIQNLSARKGGATLEHLNLELRDRAFTVVTGPAGAGKGLLLRIIAGLEKPAQGEVQIGERNVTTLAPAKREVAMVFAEDGLYPGMTVRGNIAHGLKLRKFSPSETARRVQDAAEALRIGEALEARPRELSPEQRQRAAIARAVARQPKVLLFDEPLRQFEGATKAKLRAELRKLHERLEATVLYATREPGEALALGEEIVVLDQGSVQQAATRTAILETPGNLFVAGFLGVPPMNRIEGTIKAERETLLFREKGEGTIEVRFPLGALAQAEEYAGRSVVLGVRPEDLELVEAARGQEPANSFPALVDAMESIGAQLTLTLDTGAHILLARSEKAAGEGPTGRRVRCLLRTERAHFFDPASGFRLPAA